jgi:hypothetical protein
VPITGSDSIHPGDTTHSSDKKDRMEILELHSQQSFSVFSLLKESLVSHHNDESFSELNSEMKTEILQTEEVSSQRTIGYTKSERPKNKSLNEGDNSHNQPQTKLNQCVDNISTSMPPQHITTTPAHHKHNRILTNSKHTTTDSPTKGLSSHVTHPHPQILSRSYHDPTNASHSTKTSATEMNPQTTDQSSNLSHSNPDLIVTGTNSPVVPSSSFSLSKRQNRRMLLEKRKGVENEKDKE